MSDQTGRRGFRMLFSFELRLPDRLFKLFKFVSVLELRPNLNLYRKAVHAYNHVDRSVAVPGVVPEIIHPGLAEDGGQLLDRLVLIF